MSQAAIGASRTRYWLPKLTTLAAAAMVVVLSFKCGKADSITARAIANADGPKIVGDLNGGKINRAGGTYGLYTTLLVPNEFVEQKINQTYQLGNNVDFIQDFKRSQKGEAFAKAEIKYDMVNWNSDTSKAEATWKKGPDTIVAIARVTDPAHYIVEALLSGEQVFLGLVFSSGMTLSAPTYPELGLSSYAEISGVFETDLFSPGSSLDRLWEYKWSASGSGGSLFEFRSNPELGFDDAAIQSAFMNSVNNIGGGSYVLGNNLSWDSDVSQFLSQTGTTSFVLGGDISLLAVAVPEPSTFAMGLASLACGGFALWKRRRRAR